VGGSERHVEHKNSPGRRHLRDGSSGKVAALQTKDRVEEGEQPRRGNGSEAAAGEMVLQKSAASTQDSLQSGQDLKKSLRAAMNVERDYCPDSWWCSADF